MNTIEPIKVPKWGLAMEEGTITHWYVSEGDRVAEGDDIVEVETTKITNEYQAHKGGLIRKIVAQEGDLLPVGALIAVMAEPEVSDADIDAFIASFEIQDGEDGDETVANTLVIRSVEIGEGRSLRVGIAGEKQNGTPVVLIHGYGGDLENWSLVMGELASNIPVYAIEMPGHGQSTKNVGEGKLADLVEGVISAIDSLGLDSFLLGGHSLGGAVACAISARIGNKVSGLFLVAPAAMKGGALSSEYLEGFVTAKRTRDMKAPAAMLFHNPDMVTREMLEQLVRFKRMDGAQAALEAISENLSGKDPEYGNVSEFLNAFDGPVTLVASKYDKVVGSPSEDSLLAHVNVKWYENVGHMPHIEAYDRIVSEIMEMM